MRDILVLCYHAVSEHWESELAVTPSQLERQVDSLLRRGYVPATFSQALSDPPAARTLAVTFDDAYRSVADLAKPILDRLGAVASVYAPTDWIGRDAPMSWPGISHWLGTPFENELLAMDWPTLEGLQSAGWEIGSHTKSHPRLTQLDDATLAVELRDSRDACSAALKKPCETLAFPYGDVDDRVVAAAHAAGYRWAGALPTQPHRPHPLEWPRVGVYRWDGDRRFKLKVSPIVRRVRRLPIHRLAQPLSRRIRTVPTR